MFRLTILLLLVMQLSACSTFASWTWPWQTEKAPDQQSETVYSSQEQQAESRLWIRVPFASGRVNMDPASRKALVALAGKYLDGKFKQNLLIQGYCDDEPIGGYNGNNKPVHVYSSQLALSQARADAVANVLVKAGIPGNIIQAQGFGGSNYIADNTSKSGRDRNRRVDVFLTNP